MDYNIFYLFIILLLTFREVNTSSDWNIRNLLQQYFTLCGPSHFCSMHDFTFPWTTQADDIKHNCPPCSCQKKCWLESNCCPDLYFSHPEPICISPAIIKKSSYYKESSTFLMINSCPKNTVEETKRKCEGNSSSIEKILYPPVTSQTSSLAYLNRYCADCNFEFSYDPWPLKIVCDVFVDINFFSSFEELIEKGKKNRCNILPYPPQEETNYKCTKDMQVQVHFDSCNKTGSWETFDYDIKRGCELRYINNDTIYKNMFCKICNPPLNTENVIGRCNVTGMWDEYNPTQEIACLNNDVNPGSFPYKNVFCFSCNKPSRFNSNFLDVSAEIKTQIFKRTSTFYSDISILNFDEDFFIAKITGEQRDSEKRPNKTTTKTVIKSPNITNILFKGISLDGNVNTCGNYSIPIHFSFSSYYSYCSCDPKCIFTDVPYDCCADVALNYPSICLSEKELSGKDAQSNAKKLLVTNGCYGRKEFPEFIVSGCHKQFEDVFSMHPVTDVSSGIPYLNMYCLQCNQSPSTKLARHKPWDIRATCSFYIDISNFLLFSDFLKALRATGCDTYYQPPHSRAVTQCQNFNSQVKTCFQKSNNIIDKCNKTGNWPYKDPDIQWACESMPPGSLPLWPKNGNGQNNTYKNIYCALCNPPEWSDASVDKCQATWINEQMCNFFPRINFVHPYKNIFCNFCTTFRRPKKRSCTREETVHVAAVNVLDRYFSFSSYFLPLPVPAVKSLNYLYAYPRDNFSIGAASERQCTEAQNLYPIMGGCRNITCYPGKTLNLGKSCMPLFREARNLRYHIDAYFNCSTQYNASIGDIMTHIHRFTFSKLQSLFGQSSLRELITNIDKPCKRETFLENYFQLHLSFKLFFENPVQRLQRELNILDIKYKFSIPGFIMISNVPSAESYWFCSFYYNDCSYNRIKYREVRVSNLLVCTQIEFSPEEFEIYETGKNTFMLLKMYNITLEADDFDILPEGTARVCVSTLRKIHGDTRTTFKLNLKKSTQHSITDVVLLTLSSIFLFITFCTYCIFHELRTLPGGTIMILVAVLFTTDVFILTGSGREINTTRCVVYGIITHYLWLTSFFSMNICSFHLYRVFHSKFARVNQTNKWGILGKYSIYVLVTPLLVVSCNIAVTMTKQSYIGYGKVKCFIDKSLHLIAFFLIPIGLLCIMNLFFFIKTLSTIIRSPKVRKNKAKTNEFSIFARLFTITGATWLLQILNGFLEEPAFSDVVGVVNSLQGVLIFIAFMCNRRTLKLYQRLILQCWKKEGSTTNVT